MDKATELEETARVICDGDLDKAGRVPRWTALRYYSAIEYSIKQSRKKLAAYKKSLPK